MDIYNFFIPKNNISYPRKMEQYISKTSELALWVPNTIFAHKIICPDIKYLDILFFTSKFY